MKINWTTREWNLIAKRLVDKEVNPDHHGWRGSLINEMKSVLPADRWRSSANLSTAKVVLVPLMKQVLRESELPKPGPIIAEPQKPTASSLSTEDLLVELARRLAVMLEAPRIIYGANPLKNDVDSQVQHWEKHLKHNPEPVSDGKVRKFRVLVAGPNPDLEHALVKEFPNLELRFSHFKENPSRAADKARGCDRALLLTKFINHSTADAIKNSGVTYTMVTGAKEARDWLAALP